MISVRVFRSGFFNGSPFMTSIRSRLYAAFGFVAALTITSSLIALYAFTTISDTTTSIVSRNMPATIQSLRLAEETSQTLALVPQLMTVEDQQTQKKLSDKITQHMASLSSGIEHLKRWDDTAYADINTIYMAMSQRVMALKLLVEGRIELVAQRQKGAVAVRLARDQFIGRISPAADDANDANDVLLSNSNPSAIKTSQRIPLDRLRILLELKSEATLLAGLLSEGSVAELPRVEALLVITEGSKKKIEKQIEFITDPDLRDSLKAFYGALGELVGQNGIVAIRSRELNALELTRAAFDATQQEAARLKFTVDRLVQARSESTKAVSEQAANQIRSGRFILIALLMTALIAAVLIAWLYVGRNIVRRLGDLRNAMQKIAEGDLEVSIPDDGNDEIAAMARTLRIFRKATADVTDARRREAERARDAETKRNTVQSATDDFERTVSVIVETLDRSSHAMDTSARTMTDTAKRNQNRAGITAEASEEATRNVTDVALAAEQMARTIDKIGIQMSGSAAVARHAAGETENAMAAVERLSTSMDQIGEVSALIRNIAAQTNLLALNATIEAARAGAAGRGFAVVAQEVKSLATQTEKATENIAQQIASIGATTTHAIEAMKGISQTIAQLDQNAGVVACAIVEQSAVTQHIASSAIAAAQGTQNVSASVEEVSQAATETEEVAEDVLRAGNDLSNSSRMLRSEVEKFLERVRAA
jgi:methyl-accepting chemotaxis protein